MTLPHPATPVTLQGDRKAHVPSDLPSPQAKTTTTALPELGDPTGNPHSSIHKVGGHALALVRQGATFRLEEGAGVRGQSEAHAKPPTTFPWGLPRAPGEHQVRCRVSQEGLLQPGVGVPHLRLQSLQE